MTETARQILESLACRGAIRLRCAPPENWADSVLSRPTARRVLTLYAPARRGVGASAHTGPDAPTELSQT